MSRDPMNWYNDGGEFLQQVNQRIRKAVDNSGAIHKATQDAIIYGNGWLRVDADGNLHRLDPTRILVDYKLD